MNSQLPFTCGFELEFALPAPEQSMTIFRAVRSKGYSMTNFGRWRHTPPSADAWDLKTDGSCGVTPGVPGFEAVSPVIAAYPDLLYHANVARIIAKNGGLINHRCGLHVHIGFAEYLNPENIQLLFRFLSRYEQAFYFLVPHSRRASQYCKPMPGSIVDTVQRRHGEVNISQLWSDKNTWVNFQTLGRIGTVEFRLMFGTLDPEFIVSYIMFLEHTLAAIIGGKKKVQWGKAAAQDNKMLFYTMLQQAGFYGKASQIDKDRALIGRQWAAIQFEGAGTTWAAVKSKKCLVTVPEVERPVGRQVDWDLRDLPATPAPAVGPRPARRRPAPEIRTAAATAATAGSVSDIMAQINTAFVATANTTTATTTTTGPSFNIFDEDLEDLDSAQIREEDSEPRNAGNSSGPL